MLRQAMVVLVLLLIGVVPVQADVVEKIEITIAFGGDTIFDAQDPASSSQLSWQNGSGAMVWKDTDPNPFMADDCAIVGNFSSMTDNSGGGIASARFNSGAWEVSLYDAEGLLANDYLVMRVGGTLDWYNESETGDDELTGVGIVTVDDFWIDSGPAFFGSSPVWGAGPDGKSGIQAQTSLLSLDPADYATDFTADSLTLVIFADSSYMPEPATVTLLALGALAGLRRRR